MAILKCKMCGGALEIAPGATVCECEYCGSTQTVPALDNEKKITLFDRANRLRAACEFDKAAGVYESIVADFNQEAEAYWGLVLCKYGIEYVDDPATAKKIPTCHRSSFDSIFDDSNFDMVMENADIGARGVYRQEAKQIEEIRKGIIEVSSKEEPYDIFICYKETDENGNRTLDSVLAQDIYTELTEKGYKVFFSRITLEDKLGQEYEPYIFAALNSAKVMLAVGTSYDNYNAVWVKNEWSRFLKLISAGQKKTLIPCYKNIDAYDMPKEFAKLQAQDMGKVGAMQDLMRGIQKIIGETASGTVVKETVVVSNNVQTTVEPLLKRVFMFLEDGNWSEADTYCEKVLDLDPENARAYLGKLMAELRVHKQSDLKNCPEPFDKKISYQKAIRFADSTLVHELENDIKFINERNDLAWRTGVYKKAVDKMNAVKEEEGYKSAAELFQQIPDFKNAQELAEQCTNKAELLRCERLYEHAKENMTGEMAYRYESALISLRKIPGWKDVDELIFVCEKKIAEIEAAEEAAKLEAERKEEEHRIAAEKVAQKWKKIIATIMLIVVVCIAFLFVWKTVIIPKQKLNKAMSLIDSGDYDSAYALIEELGTSEAIISSKYDRAMNLIDSGDYEVALKLLKGLEYKDSDQKIEEILSIKPNWNYLFANIGDIVTFGKYEQDNDTSNGREDVEWIVLAKEDNRILVISEKGLDCQPYNTTKVNVTWDSCTLRRWMNTTFINAAFGVDEQSLILSANISSDNNPKNTAGPGNPGYAPDEKVFLLSKAEVKKYFSSDSARQCKPTKYAVANGVYVDDNNENCWWWLLSPGRFQHSVAGVNNVGSVDISGNDVSCCRCVRPAMWISVE